MLHLVTDFNSLRKSKMISRYTILVDSLHIILVLNSILYYPLSFTKDSEYVYSYFIFGI